MKPKKPTAYYSGDTYALDESIGQSVVRASVLFKRLVDRRMADHDLTSVQWKPLWMLQAGMGSTAQELTALLHIDPGATTRLLNRLEAKGLVTRERSSEDRRVVHVRLTPAGRAAVRPVPYVLAEINNQALRDFTPAEFEQFKGYLQRLRHTLQADVETTP